LEGITTRKVHIKLIAKWENSHIKRQGYVKGTGHRNIWTRPEIIYRDDAVAVAEFYKERAIKQPIKRYRQWYGLYQVKNEPETYAEKPELEALEELHEAAEPEMVQVQEVHIYGIENKRTKDKREYGIFELSIDVPANVKSQDIADFLEKQGIYNLFEFNDSGKPNLNERRIKVAGMKTARVADLKDWQQQVKDKLGHVRWKKDRQRGEKAVVAANKGGHQQHIKADEESAKGRS
jgi:hypothetical protein